MIVHENKRWQISEKYWVKRTDLYIYLKKIKERK